MASTFRQYWDLTKPRVVALIVFTALVGMCLAIEGLPDGGQLLRGALGFLGIWLAAPAPPPSTSCWMRASTRRWRAPRGVRWCRAR